MSSLFVEYLFWQSWFPRPHPRLLLVKLMLALLECFVDFNLILFSKGLFSLPNNFFFNCQGSEHIINYNFPIQCDGSAYVTVFRCVCSLAEILTSLGTSRRIVDWPVEKVKPRILNSGHVDWVQGPRGVLVIFKSYSYCAFYTDPNI